MNKPLENTIKKKRPSSGTKPGRGGQDAAWAPCVGEGRTSSLVRPRFDSALSPGGGAANRTCGCLQGGKFCSENIKYQINEKRRAYGRKRLRGDFFTHILELSKQDHNIKKESPG
jgi:hypothetical protein